MKRIHLFIAKVNINSAGETKTQLNITQIAPSFYFYFLMPFFLVEFFFIQKFLSDVNSFHTKARDTLSENFQ